MSEISIRAAAPEDLIALLALYRHLNPNDLEPDGAAAATAYAIFSGPGGRPSAWRIGVASWRPRAS